MIHVYLQLIHGILMDIVYHWFPTIYHQSVGTLSEPKAPMVTTATLGMGMEIIHSLGIIVRLDTSVHIVQMICSMVSGDTCTHYGH